MRFTRQLMYLKINDLRNRLFLSASADFVSLLVEKITISFDRQKLANSPEHSRPLSTQMVSGLCVTLQNLGTGGFLFLIMIVIRASLQACDTLTLRASTLR